MSSSNVGSRRSTGYEPTGPSWPMIVSPCHSRRMRPAKSSIWAVVMRGMPKASNMRRDAATDAEGEAAAGQAVHRRGVRRGHDRVAGVVVRRGGDDLHVRRRDRRGTREGGRLLDVEALGDEHGAEAELLGATALVDEVARVLGAAGERVEAEFREPWVGHDTDGFVGPGSGAGVFSRMNTAARTSASVASGMYPASIG